MVFPKMETKFIKWSGF